MKTDELIETIMLVALGDEEWNARKLIIEDLLCKDYQPNGNLKRLEDSPRLKQFCHTTSVEVKATGGIGAATSLEMIEYIRQLERGLIK